MALLQTADLQIELPSGWEGRITRFAPPSDGPPLPADGLARVHASTRPLDAVEGDYGSGLVETLGATDVFLALLEHEPQVVGSALFDRPLPQSLHVDDFNPLGLQRPLPGQSGAQAFCTVAGRPFCLYVVLGAHAHRARVLPVVNGILASIAIR